MNSEKVEMEVAVQCWKDLKINHCIMDFSCGGDEMQDFDFVFYGEYENVLLSDTLNDFFKVEVFEKVDFYVNSSDEYIGEFGTVRIELNEKQADFEYTKSTTSELSERITESFVLQLTDEEFNIFRDKIKDINGEGRSVYFNYKSDCIISDDEISILEKFERKIKNFITDAIIENEHGEQEEESENFECDVEDTLNTEEKTIDILVSRSFYYTVSE
jgi:hypothetical protein